MRLDLFLVNFNYVDSRTRAQNLIKLGFVMVDNRIINKPSYEVSEFNNVEVTENYVASLGGMKLERALESFSISPCDMICVDIGASNGGFTDILLKNGCKKVYAVDVGECALPEYIKQNEKVVVMDKTNARFLDKSQFEEEIDLVVIDVSFISLELILPSIFGVCCDKTTIVALIKPQFELSKKDLTKTGIVKNKKLEKQAVEKIVNCVKVLGKEPVSLTLAPHPFEYKNQEYLICIR